LTTYLSFRQNFRLSARQTQTQTISNLENEEKVIFLK